MSDLDNQEFLRALQAKYEKKLTARELEVLGYWKDHLDRLLVLKPEGIASLQTQVRKLSDMMATRISTLKKGLP